MLKDLVENSYVMRGDCMDAKVCGFLHEKVWAVVGASSNPDKFGYRIYKVLTRYGYTVYPVNPKETSIEGRPCYPSLAALPEKCGVVDVVVPPTVAATVARECAALGIGRVWFQPGTFDDATIAAAEAAGVEYVHKRCAMVESSKLYAVGRKRWAVAGNGGPAAGLREFLAAHGHEAYAVGPGGSLAALPATPEVVVVAAAGAAAEQAIKESGALGVQAVWLEAGFSTEELIKLAVSLRMVAIHGAALAEEYEGALKCRAGSPVR